MGLKVKVNRVTNANVILNGKTTLGTAEEVSAPVVKFKNSTHKALGMIGEIDIFSGIEKMECKIKWNSYYSETLSAIGDPTKVIKMQIRCNVEAYDNEGRSAQLPGVIFMNVSSKDFPLGSFKQHDNVELETNFNVYSYRLEVGGEAIHEIDVLSNIFKVNGVDIMTEYRSNLGID